MVRPSRSGSTPTLASFAASSSAASSSGSSMKFSDSGQSRVHSSGRGGLGNIRRLSSSLGVDDGERSHISTGLTTQDSNVKSISEGKTDEVVAPKGRELLVTVSTPGIKSSGRGGSGNIGLVRKALTSPTESKFSREILDAMEAREREVLAAHRAKKQAQATKMRTSGRGGLGNLSSKTPVGNNGSKQKNKQKTKATRYAQSVNSLRRSSSSKRSLNSSHRKKNSSRTSIDRISIYESQDAIELSPQPIASTSTLLPPPSLDKRSAPGSPKLRPITRPESPHMFKEVTSETSGKPLATKWDQLFQPSHGAASVASRPTSPTDFHHQKTKMPAGGGGEWRLVTHVREERHGLHQVFIEEQGWEYMSPAELKKERRSRRITGLNAGGAFSDTEEIELQNLSLNDGRSKSRKANRVDYAAQERRKQAAVANGYMSDGAY